MTAGVAGNASGSYQAGMGVACGDLDGDGRLDLAVTNFYNESTTFYRNLGQGFFGDQTAAIGLAGPSRYVLGFGIAFLDADNDGWLDLITANGHVHDGRPQFPWKMPVQLFLNDGRGRVMDVTRRAGPPFQVLRMGRGLAAGDLDNDGRLDVVIVSQNEPVALFHNQTDSRPFPHPPPRGHHLEPRRRRRRGHRPLRRPGPGRSSLRRGQLPVRRRSSPAFRPGRGPTGRPRRGPLAVGPRRPSRKPRRRCRLPAPRGQIPHPGRCPAGTNRSSPHFSPGRTEAEQRIDRNRSPQRHRDRSAAAGRNPSRAAA